MGAEQFGRFNLWAILNEVLVMLTNAFSTSLTGRGAIPVIFKVDATALTGNVDITNLPYKIRVIDAWCVNTATPGAGDTIQVLNSASAITNAIDINVGGDTAINRAGQINDANQEISKGGTLRITGASAANAIVYVKALRVS
jgi:hypothetical protein